MNDEPIIHAEGYLHFCLWLSAATRIDEQDYCNWLHANADRLRDGFFFSGQEDSELAAWCRMQYVRAMGGT